MPMAELSAEIRAAAASLLTAAAAAENGDVTEAEIGVEDALFRVQSILPRIQAVATATPPRDPPDDLPPN